MSSRCKHCGTITGQDHDPDCLFNVPPADMEYWRQGRNAMYIGALIDTKGLTESGAVAYLAGMRCMEKEMAAEQTKELTRAVAPNL